ncbi:MAG: thermonuclease family protein [Gammaproteobacteria bacterium]|nr:thermonuclease family protein [Gammaproteobacteria bacterium]
MILVLVLAPLAACWSQTVDGDSYLAPARYIDVLDGDSLVVKRGRNEFEIRLYGIDAPEFGQPWSDEARAALRKLVRGHDLRIEVVTTDRYERAVAQVFRASDDTSVNAGMIAEGHAWVYRRYTDNRDWIRLERAARRQKSGLWRLPRSQRIPPWEWRELNRNR